MAADTAKPAETLVGISFKDPFRAQEYLTAARGMAARKGLGLKDAVIIAKDTEGHTTVVETTDPQPARTAMSGAMWAGLLGLLIGGPVGWAAGIAVGASAGAITAKVVDIGIRDEWVEWFRKAGAPGTSIVALLVTDLDKEALITEVARFSGAHLVYANLDEQVLDRLRSALDEPLEPLDEPVGQVLGETTPTELPNLPAGLVRAQISNDEGMRR